MTATRITDHAGHQWPVTGHRCRGCGWPLDPAITDAGRHPSCTHPPDLLNRGDLGDLDQTTGPCVLCGTPTTRYGDAGNPLCDRCRASRATTNDKELSA